MLRGCDNSTGHEPGQWVGRNGHSLVLLEPSRCRGWEVRGLRAQVPLLPPPCSWAGLLELQSLPPEETLKGGKMGGALFRSHDRSKPVT